VEIIAILDVFTVDTVVDFWGHWPIVAHPELKAAFERLYTLANKDSLSCAILTLYE
jgi:hypothetical protein